MLNYGYRHVAKGEKVEIRKDGRRRAPVKVLAAALPVDGLLAAAS